QPVGSVVSWSELLAVLRTGEQRVGIVLAKLCGLRSSADQHLPSGKVEVEKGLDVLLNGDAANVEEDRLRAIEEHRPRPEQIDVDTARPRHQALEAARLELSRHRWRGDESAGGAVVKP